MLNEETKRKLRELNIGELITAIEFQQQDPTTVSLSFDERMQRLVDYLYLNFQRKFSLEIEN